MPNSQIILYDCMHNFHSVAAVCPFYLLLSKTALVDNFFVPIEPMDDIHEIWYYIDP